MARRFLQHDLSDIGGIHRHPAEFDQELFRATMLCRGDVARIRTETLISECGRCDSDSVEIARRDALCPHQADEKGVEVGTFAPDIAAAQQGYDVAVAADSHAALAIGVLDDQ